VCRKVAGAELAAKVTSTVVFPTQDARIIIYLYNKAGGMPAFLLYSRLQILKVPEKIKDILLTETDVLEPAL